jgi:hypothetical protein
MAVVAAAAAAWFYHNRRSRRSRRGDELNDPLLVGRGAGAGAGALESGTEMQPAATLSIDTTCTALVNATSSTSLQAHNTSSTATPHTSNAAPLNTSSAVLADTAVGVHFGGHTSAAAVGADGAGAGAFPASRPGAPPAEVAEFEKETGAPKNKAAKTELAKAWMAGTAVERKKTRVVQLPFTDLESATQGFDDLNEIGGGAR